ncbi:uncharacterized protein GGS22DRAFT_148610 [Annulohypoxylon maeteangense]|uniref:uncharacterized protein n=1 Tax=Annulohypoxylon maeteangense TaxID=1927788 RepID=UPI002007F287|nr:uncharacterized protein GGS22DRAFT_148610 [Annulohypoxylon maeteangense]KAI0889563.1 hypothetical protein GGS22DRAFT_148610 [Annulohypoxylon maeteangense]
MGTSDNNQQPAGSSHNHENPGNEKMQNTTSGPRHTATKKKIIICCDGTWNSENSNEQRSNVSEISRCIMPYDQDGVPQIVFYQPGVGTGTSKLGNVWEGLTGRGLYENICEAYSFLCHNYSHEDDEIFLVGFSRGAFTVRCVAEFLNDVGLLEKRGMMNVLEVFKLWEVKIKVHSLCGWGRRLKPSPAELLQQKINDLEGKGALRRNIKVKACAVWDTVSSLGIPMPWFIPQPGPRKLKFVNSHLCPNIEHAFQALALHERRRHFLPIVWKLAPEAQHNTEKIIPDRIGQDTGDIGADVRRHQAAQPGGTVLKQCWFLGCHGDVGGGNQEAGLSHISLIWMLSQLNPFLSIGIENLRQPATHANRHHDEEIANAAETSDMRKTRTGIWLFLDVPLRLPLGDGEIDMSWRVAKQFTSSSTIRVRDSLRGLFRIGGSRLREPCSRFLGNYGIEEVKKPDFSSSNETMHFTTRLLLADEIIMPPQSLKDTRTISDGNKEIWKFPGPKLSCREQRTPYVVGEDEPNAVEMELLQWWLKVSQSWLIHGASNGKKDGGTKLGDITLPLLRRLNDHRPHGGDSQWPRPKDKKPSSSMKSIAQNWGKELFGKNK